MATICSSTAVGFANLLSCMNEITLGLFSVAILFGIFLVIYFRNRTSAPKEALVGASWITLMVAVLLRVGGMLDDVYLGMCFVLAIGSLALLVLRR